jgi:hypothetical protein
MREAPAPQQDVQVAAIPRPRLLARVAPPIKGRIGSQDIAIVLAVRLMEGSVDAEVQAWLRSAFIRWRREGGNLITYLHLPTSRRFRIACRDLWLRDAARYCSGTPWPRTHQLQSEIARFQAYRWKAWQRQDGVPTGARSIEACLFLACKSYPELPRSKRALYRIIADAFSEDDDTIQGAP